MSCDNCLVSTTCKKDQVCGVFNDFFLECCKTVGIKKLSIRTKHESVKSSLTFTFGVERSLFSDERYYDGLTSEPAIWTAVELAKLDRSVGNAYQYQSSDKRLINGIYHLVNDEWNKII